MGGIGQGARAVKRIRPRKCALGKEVSRSNLWGLETKKGTSKRSPFQAAVARLTGLEPATPGVTGRYSNQLSYNRPLHSPGRPGAFRCSMVRALCRQARFVRKYENFASCSWGVWGAGFAASEPAMLAEGSGRFDRFGRWCSEGRAAEWHSFLSQPSEAHKDWACGPDQDAAQAAQAILLGGR